MRRSILLVCILSLLVLVFASTASAANPSNNTSKPISASNTSNTVTTVDTHLVGVQVPFVENQGQQDPQVEYYANTYYGTSYVTQDGLVHQINGPGNTNTVVKESFVDSNGHNIRLNPVGEYTSSTKVNYFVGDDPKQWRTGVKSWNMVNLGELWPGITVKLKAYGGNVEKLFYLSPYANPEDIKIRLTGADNLQIGSGGSLVINPASNVSMSKPIAYQELPNGKQTVEANYQLTGDGYGFILGNYDRQYPLVIDPVLNYSTYLGGNGNDWAGDITVDNEGYVYITGYTNSNNFPTQNPIQTYQGGWDAFITKINPSGNSLVYSTYLGGKYQTDLGLGITVDGDGNVYVTGVTYSTDFPTINPYQPALAGDGDVFIAKLNPTSSALIYSTYLGGTGYEAANGIVVDNSENAYITGWVWSTNFPTQNPYQSTYGGGSWDAFITKLNATGNALVYSTYLGGSEADLGEDIKLSSDGSVYIAGVTGSTNFPTQNPIQTYQGGEYDAFVTKLNPTGNALIYSTCLGGTGIDEGLGLAVDSEGNAYITGYTSSNNFPTQNPYQSVKADGNDAFVTKLNPSGNALAYSTYLGGNSDDYGFGIAVDNNGNAYITGYTTSNNFPTQNPIQTYQENQDAFVTKLNSAGNALIYSTYLGGNSADHGYGIAVDSSRNAYITGYTYSTNFPTQNPIQTYQGNQDAFVAKIVSNNSPVANPNGPYTTYEGSQITFDASASYDPDGDPLIYLWDLDGDGIFESTGVQVSKTWMDDYEGMVTLKVTDTYGESNTASTNVTVQNVTPTTNISDSYFAKVPITLRIAGTPGSKVTLQIIQEGLVIISKSIVRTIGCPNKVTLMANIDMSKPYIGRLLFEPDPKKLAINPVWLIIDGKKHHVATFVSLKGARNLRDIFRKKHCTPWTFQKLIDVPLKGLFTLVGKEITFKAEAFDPSIDTLSFKWEFGDTTQPVINTKTSNGTTSTIDTVTHTFSKKGIYTITLKVKDDDGAETTNTKTFKIF